MRRKSSILSIVMVMMLMALRSLPADGDSSQTASSSTPNDKKPERTVSSVSQTGQLQSRKVEVRQRRIAQDDEAEGFLARAWRFVQEWREE